MKKILHCAKDKEAFYVLTCHVARYLTGKSLWIFTWNYCWYSDLYHFYARLALQPLVAVAYFSLFRHMKETWKTLLAGFHHAMFVLQNFWKTFWKKNEGLTPKKWTLRGLIYHVHGMILLLVHLFLENWFYLDVDERVLKIRNYPFYSTLYPAYPYCKCYDQHLNMPTCAIIKCY